MSTTDVLRRFARDRWVRLHGTPRVTVVVGGEHARQIYAAWLAQAGLTGLILEGDDLDADVRTACGRAAEHPNETIAICTPLATLARWRVGRTDRLAAMVDEGMVTVPDPIDDVADPPASAVDVVDARSAAEATLFEALEATRATAGRFELNGNLSVRFGPVAAECDLLSRADRIAIEIDGIHHFENLDRYRRDRRKDLLLQRQGLFVIRLLAEDVLGDPRGAVNVVCEALAYRRGSGE